MKRVLSLAFAVTLSVCAFGQQSNTPTAFGGMYAESAYASYSVKGETNVIPGTQTVTLSSSSITLSDGRSATPFVAGTAITVDTGSAQEIVTIASSTGCTSTGGTCLITATFANPHSSGFLITSATSGLQEAINDANQHGGGTVLVDGAATASTVAAANGFTDVAVQLPRAGGFTIYTSQGGTYSQQSFGIGNITFDLGSISSATCGNTVIETGDATVEITLPVLPNACAINIKDYTPNGEATLTLQPPAGWTIENTTSLSFGQNQSALLYVDAPDSNIIAFYYSEGGSGGANIELSNLDQSLFTGSGGLASDNFNVAGSIAIDAYCIDQQDGSIQCVNGADNNPTSFGVLGGLEQGTASLSVAGGPDVGLQSASLTATPYGTINSPTVSVTANSTNGFIWINGTGAILRCNENGAVCVQAQGWSVDQSGDAQFQSIFIDSGEPSTFDTNGFSGFDGSGVVFADHYSGASPYGALPPTVVAGSAAGSGASASLDASRSDAYFNITVTAGTGPSAGQTAVVTFGVAYGNTPHCTFSPDETDGGTANAANAASVATVTYGQADDVAYATWTLYSHLVSGSYSWTVHCGQ